MTRLIKFDHAARILTLSNWWSNVSRNYSRIKN